MNRDFGSEIDSLKEQLQGLQEQIKHLIPDKKSIISHKSSDQEKLISYGCDGEIYYSGQIRSKENHYLLEPQERKLSTLLNVDTEKASKILSALGHRQRLDILRVILAEPLNGLELIERLNMGTTGQLYHHLKALLGADLLIQEERGGRYTIPFKRVLPLLLLLATVTDLTDTSDYIDMTGVRDNASIYLGALKEDGFNVHYLLGAVIENCIMEHKAGYCTKVNIYLHEEGSITVSDNGRGIPINILPNSDKSIVQSILTNINQSNGAYYIPGGEKGTTIAVVNALSQKLIVEIKREGNVYRQEYIHGIPQTRLMVVGATEETGTSVTLKPNNELFKLPINKDILHEELMKIGLSYPDLSILLADGNFILNN